MKIFIKNTLRWLNLLLILVTVLAYLSPFFNPAIIWHFSFLGLAYPFLLLSNVLFILFWLWRRDRYFLFSTGCILAGFGYFSGFMGLNFTDEDGTTSTPLSLMTFNVAGFRKFNKPKSEAGIKYLEEFKIYLEKEGVPDIMCIQEGAKNKVRESLQNTFKYKYFFKEKGTLLLSRYEFADSGIIPFDNTSNSCIWGDLKMPEGQVVRVYVAHLQSNWLGTEAMKIVEESDPRKKETWEGIAEVMRRYKRAATRRSTQAEMIAAHLATSPNPVILCGDLNDTPVSYVFQVLSENLQDSFSEKGLGFGFTYAGMIPGLRIDYVLADKHFKILEHQVPKLELSDHYPVLVRLERCE